MSGEAGCFCDVAHALRKTAGLQFGPEHVEQAGKPGVDIRAAQMRRAAIAVVRLVNQSRVTQHAEMMGMVDRIVVSTAPVRVEYRITPLGRTLEGPFRALCEWTADHLPEVEKARVVYDVAGKP